MNLSISSFNFFALYLWPYYQVHTNLKLLHFPGELTFYHFEAAFYIPSKIIFFALNFILSDITVSSFCCC